MGDEESTMPSLVKTVVALAIVLVAVQAVKFNTAVLKDAMEEAEDSDNALQWATSHMKKWAGDVEEVMRHVPPLKLKDAGINLQGARDLMGKSINADASNNKELRLLAMAENRLAAAKQ